MLGNWALVYAGNLGGAFLTAVLVATSHALGAGNGIMLKSAVLTATVKAGISPMEGIALGFLCNFLVCLAVWLALAEEGTAAKCMCVFAPVFLFVVTGFEHSVANMYFIPAGFLAEAFFGRGIAPADAALGFLRNIVPVTAGNILGGTALTMALGFANKRRRTN
jgi:formate/nitrite transporter FocA (FNT family)